MTAEYFKNLFTSKITNGFKCRIGGHNKKSRYMFYGNRDLNKLSKEAFDAGEDMFYAKHINPEDDPRFVERWEKADPIYEYHLKRNLTEEEYHALIALLD